MRFEENNTFKFSRPYYGLRKKTIKDILIRICKDCPNRAAKGKLRCLPCFDKYIMKKTWG